jgi:diguanylate cyclase (GGDEF)-like protein/PAS domain S-box-containing protein
MGDRLTARRVLAGYALWMALLVAAHYALTGLRAETAGLIGISGVAAMLAGVAVNRPARRAPWLLLAAANLAAALGGLSLHIVSVASHPAVGVPPFANGVYLVSYPLYVAGLALFIRSRAAGRDPRSAADALILIVGLALLSWIFLVAPGSANGSLTWLQRLASVAYLIGGLLILVTLARLLAPELPRGASTALLTLGTVALLASDAAYDLIEYSGKYSYGALLDLGWLACFTAWGAAALHPSMAELTRSAVHRPPETSRATMVMLILTSLVPPILLLAHGYAHRDEVEGLIAVVWGVLYLLMLSRLWDVASSHWRGLIRERTLRVAGVALTSAGTVQEVAAAVQDAATTLVGQPERGQEAKARAVLAVRNAAGRLSAVTLVTAATPTGLVDEVEGNRLREMTEGLLADLDRPRFIAAAEFGGLRPSGIRLPPGEGALICPLKLKDRPAGDPHIGVLVVYSQQRILADLSGALEILAGQAALAVERVTLTQEVIRQRGEALFRTLIQDTSDVILIVGDDRRVRYATPSAGGIFGDVTVEGALLADLVAPGTRDNVDRALDLMLTVGASGVSPAYLTQIERLDGRVATIEVHWSDLRGDSTVGGLVLTLRDVTGQHELEKELKYQAFHDALTGLPNRVLFVREAAAALEAARAAGRTAGVLFIDLDDFKIVNDTMGHAVGDELLVAVAARLTSSVRPSDTAARLGGDEFAMLIDDAVDPAAVDAFAERIVAAFTEPFTLNEATVLAAATVGVATSEDSDDTGELLRHADLALYAAKAAGKQRWRHYQPVLTSGMLRRREVQLALEDAVQRSAFTLAYQPIVSLASGEIAGFEALVRWPHPRWGMMLPGDFISLAEETGLIVPLGAWVLRQALRDMVRWRQGLPPRAAREPDDSPPEDLGPHVSVNVSARQFHDPGFVDSVRQALRASGLPPSALLLELTESILLGGSARIRAELAELREIGVRLAIDDFGTGYSSLGYLLDLPIDVLKIDKTFVTGIASSWRRHALVEGIIRLARTLELEVIAEGIESETERELLAEMGSQFGQGYLLSVPVDADAAAAMLRLGRGLVTELPQQRRKAPDGRYLTDL